MEKEKLVPWIEKLTAAEKKDRDGIVADLCKENNLKSGEAWKLLKEAGFDPKAAPGNGGNPNAQGGPKQKVILRHKTGYPQYRRAGLVLTQKAVEHEVTDKQLAILKKDSWVVIGDGKKEGDGE